MNQYILDTNTVSHLVKQHPKVVARVMSQPINSIYISSATHGEIVYGLARRPEAKRLHQIMHEFLKSVETLPWTKETAEIYGNLRSKLEDKGSVTGALDLLIAAQALEIGAVLVTNDKALHRIKSIRCEDWTQSGTQ